MTTEKTEYSQKDAQPIALYGKDNSDAREVYPILRDMFNPGLMIPQYDDITITRSGGTISTVVFSLSSSTVMTLNVTYSSGAVTNIVRT